MAKGHLGANAIVGGGIPIAVGGALACKMQKNGHVAVAFFGDGASNQGTFHEALNLASVWKLPVIFVCENNGFGISVPSCQSTSVVDIGVRGAGYDMPGLTIDGNDPEAIYAAFSAALKRAKAGDGPTLIECKTYRWYGHWIGDPEITRDKETTKAWKEKCPIALLKNQMIQAGRLTEEAFRILEKSAQSEADEAAEFSLNSPEPDPSTVMDDVFADRIPAIV
jgi:pyruvate dehydrogenase E1 component alpha subunit